MFLKVDNVGAERMSSGRLFQATGPASQNVRLIMTFCVLKSWTSLRILQTSNEQ